MDSDIFIISYFWFNNSLNQKQLILFSTNFRTANLSGTSTVALMHIH